MSADTKQSRMNRALIWTFLWVLWLGGGLQNRMLVPGAPYFWLNLIITLAGGGFRRVSLVPLFHLQGGKNGRQMKGEQHGQLPRIYKQARMSG